MLAALKLNSEFLRLKRSKLTRVAVVFLCLMPLLYSALYLAAFWDPFNKVNQVPVALVNSDSGAVVDGKELHAGDQVAEGLQDNDKINWIQTDAQDAAEGVANGRYYFSLEIPSNFSEAIGSPTTDNPEKAQLVSTYNDANGYLSTVIGQNVMREVLNVVGDKISSQAVDKILLGVVNAGTGMQKAADGAGQIADGTGQLRDGSGKLDDGMGKLQDGLNKAKDGSGKLRDGSGKLHDGIGKLHDGAGTLADGTGQLLSEVNKVTGEIEANQSKFNDLGGLVNQAGRDATNFNNSFNGLRDQVNNASNSQAGQANQLRDQAKNLRNLGIPAAMEAARQLDEAANTLDSVGVGPNSTIKLTMDQLSKDSSNMAYQLSDPNAPVRSNLDKIVGLPDKVHQLHDGVTKFNDGAIKLRDNLGTAHDKAGQLEDGIVKLDDGNLALVDGANKLKDGTQKAVDGSGKLDEGAKELRDKLNDGAQQVPQWNDSQRLQAASTIGGPVAMESFNDSGSNTFGGGLAPFFFSLALYIGGIIVFVMLRPLQARTVNSGISPWRAAWSGYLPSLLIGIAQACIMVAVTVWAVGLEPHNLWGLFAFAILVSAVYMAINQALIALFGPGPGKVLALAFLMLQMVSSGGLYPVEMQDSFYSWVHPLNPMTYTVNGFRQVTYGFYDERLPIAIIVLILVGLGAFAVTSLSARGQRTWTMKRLHPPLPA